MPYPQNLFQVKLCIIFAMYILKAYIVKYKNKKRLNKFFLSYKCLTKNTFLSHSCLIAEITQVNI